MRLHELWLLLKLAQYYNKPMQFFLSFVIPFGLVISVPVQIVLKGTWSAWPVIGIIILAAAVFNIIGVLLWNAGVRAYESTGS